MGEIVELIPKEQLTIPQLLARYALAEHNCEAAILDMHDTLEVLQQRTDCPTIYDGLPDYDGAS